MDARQVIAAVCAWAVLLMSCSPAVAVTEAERSAYAAAVEYCRSKAGQLVLNEEKSIFCFDGEVPPERDASSLSTLNDEGLFVVRSPGGDGTNAVRIARLIGEKRATIVIYDYCISACAHFFFVASDKTFVSQDTLVAWHHGWDGWPLCDAIERKGRDGSKILTRTFCHRLPAEYEASRRDLQDIAHAFFRQRVIDWTQFNLERPPQSTYMAKILRSRFEGTGTYPSVVWMWNPRYYKNVLKTKVYYDSYPESQDRVDELVARYLGERATGFFGPSGGRVLHDP
jgi:hypothetical protein